MAKKKRGDAHGGGHGWFVTFADLMGLMMSFFVMLVAFSTMDNNKLKIVAGSMRDAFGVQTEMRYSGIIESDGLPTRPKLKNTAHIPPEEASNTPTPDQQERARHSGRQLKIDREFALASASLRQALQDMPELTEISKHIMFEETKEGLNLEIVDQDGRSMFADGSKVPYERTRRLIEKLAASAQGDAAADLDRRSHRGGFRADAQRLWRVRSVRRSCQRGAPDPGAGRAAAEPYLRGIRQGGYPATVSRRSVAGGKPAGDHHLDARRSAVTAQSEAIISPVPFYRCRDGLPCRRSARRRCYARSVDRPRLSGDSGRIKTTH